MLFSEPKSSVNYPTACGGNLRDPGERPSAEYRGKRYYFCTKACLRVFEAEPDKFMAGQIPHPIEEE